VRESLLDLVDDLADLAGRRLGLASVDPGRLRWRFEQALLDELRARFGESLAQPQGLRPMHQQGEAQA
jgi:hypothetical protein